MYFRNKIITESLLEQTKKYSDAKEKQASRKGHSAYPIFFKS